MLGTSFIEFKLDYSATKNLPIGKLILDDNDMFAGGHTWTIVCFPRGVRDDQSDNNGEYLSLYAATLTPTNNSTHIGMKVLFHNFLMGRDGAPSYAKSSSKIFTTSSNSGIEETWIGCHKFLKRSKLESDGYLVDGCVTFVCGLIDLNSNRIPVPPSDLGSHLGHLLHSTGGDGNGDGSDVSFSVGSETFRAHRAILAARSPVFKAQLFGSMADAQMDGITLHDVQPAAFQILLRFMYTDELPTDTDLEDSSATDLLQHMLAAADMYQLDRLKLICAQKLWDRVSPETVAAMLVCAEMHNCPELKKRCIDFFVEEKNFRSAALTEGNSIVLEPSTDHRRPPEKVPTSGTDQLRRLPTWFEASSTCSTSPLTPLEGLFLTPIPRLKKS